MHWSKEEGFTTPKALCNPRCQPPDENSEARGGEEMEMPKERQMGRGRGSPQSSLLLSGFPGGLALASLPASVNFHQCPISLDKEAEGGGRGLTRLCREQ